MNSYFLQNVQQKLQRRITNLKSIDTPDLFKLRLIQFWHFWDQYQILGGTAEILLKKFSNIEEISNQTFTGEVLHGKTEEEAAAIGYNVLRRITINEDDKGSLAKIYQKLVEKGRTVSDRYSIIKIIGQMFIDPFYDYVNDQLDEHGAILNLLLRYKHRSEWFYSEQLFKLSQVPKKAEELLALDLYAYLYDQGLDFHIEPSSITGSIDLIAAQNTTDPLLADTKVFDGNKRAKPYLLKGFNQIYTYTKQYNEPFGYLIIYKICERELSFSLETSHHIPMISHNHKTICFITIDIYQYNTPVSQRKPPETIEITEKELVSIL
jgi:hypothetical protein